MPFISEKIWNELFDKNNFLMLQNFDKLNLSKDFILSKNKVEILINLISSIRNIRSELNIPYKKSINLNIELKDRTIEKFIIENLKEIKQFLKIESVMFDKITNTKGAFIVLPNLSLFIPLDGIIDTDKEVDKLTKKKNIQNKKLTDLKNKLKNDNFLEKAPENVIDDFKFQENELKSSIEKIDQIMNTIN